MNILSCKVFFKFSFLSVEICLFCHFPFQHVEMIFLELYFGLTVEEVSQLASLVHCFIPVSVLVLTSTESAGMMEAGHQLI